jgi:hypothetical protein
MTPPLKFFEKWTPPAPPQFLAVLMYGLLSLGETVHEYLHSSLKQATSDL